MAGTITFAQSPDGTVRTITATCVGDAADGSFPATALPSFEGSIVSIRTNPGATAPTDNYDIVLTDGDGLDRLQGAGQNRDTATSEEAVVVFSGTSQHPRVDINETLTLAISNNSVNSAGIVITITYTPE